MLVRAQFPYATVSNSVSRPSSGQSVPVLDRSGSRTSPPAVASPLSSVRCRICFDPASNRCWIGQGTRFCSIVLPSFSLSQMVRLHFSPVPSVAGLELTAGNARPFADILKAWTLISTTDNSRILASDALLFSFISQATMAFIHGESYRVTDAQFFVRVNFFDSSLTRFSEVCRVLPMLSAFMDDKMRMTAFLSSSLEKMLHCRGFRCMISPGKSSTSKKEKLPESRRIIAFTFDLIRLLKWGDVSLLFIGALADCVHAAVSTLVFQGSHRDFDHFMLNMEFDPNPSCRFFQRCLFASLKSVGGYRKRYFEETSRVNHRL